MSPKEDILHITRRERNGSHMPSFHCLMLASAFKQRLLRGGMEEVDSQVFVVHLVEERGTVARQIRNGFLE